MIIYFQDFNKTNKPVGYRKKKNYDIDISLINILYYGIKDEINSILQLI